MELRKNKLGLQEFNSAEYKTEHRLDIVAILEFLAQLHLIIDSHNVTQINHRELSVHFDKLVPQFSYLNDNDECEKLAQLMLVTLMKTDDINNVNKLPANNALFLIFKFKNAIHAAIAVLETNIHYPILFLSDEQKQNTDKNKNLSLLKSLEQDLNLLFARAFDLYGMSIEAFLARFKEHVLWQSMLVQAVQVKALGQSNTV